MTRKTGTHISDEEERQILASVLEGRTDGEIAESLGVSRMTVSRARRRAGLSANHARDRDVTPPDRNRL